MDARKLHLPLFIKNAVFVPLRRSAIYLRIFAVRQNNSAINLANLIRVQLPGSFFFSPSLSNIFLTKLDDPSSRLGYLHCTDHSPAFYTPCMCACFRASELRVNARLILQLIFILMEDFSVRLSARIPVAARHSQLSLAGMHTHYRYVGISSQMCTKRYTRITVIMFHLLISVNCSYFAPAIL